MSFTPSQQVQQRNLSYLLAEKIGQRILTGEYAAESILPGEMELCDQFGVSRTAVREAVKMLAAKGMLYPRPRIGTRILPKTHWNFLDKELLTWWMTRENFSEVMQDFLLLRRSLEPQACAQAALHANEKQKQQLTDYMNEMWQLNTLFDREKWIEVDAQFHKLIYEASGNPFLCSFSNLFSPVYQSYFRAVIHDEAIKLEHHQSIVDAILRQDTHAALLAGQQLLEDDIEQH